MPSGAQETVSLNLTTPTVDFAPAFEEIERLDKYLDAFLTKPRIIRIGFEGGTLPNFEAVAAGINQASGAAQQFTAQQEKMATAARANAAAAKQQFDAEGQLINLRRIMHQGIEDKPTVVSKYSMGTGQTRTVTQVGGDTKVTIEETNLAKIAKEEEMRLTEMQTDAERRFAQALRDTAAMHEREILLSKSGTATDQEQIALLRQKAQYMIQLSQAARQVPGGAGMANTFERRSVTMSAQATGMEDAAATKALTEAEQQLIQSLRESAAWQERDLIAQKASITSDAQKIAMLRQKAAALEQLGSAARGIEGQDGFARSQEKRVVQLNAEADAMEKETAAIKAQTVALEQQYEVERKRFTSAPKVTQTQGPNGRTVVTQYQDEINGMKESVMWTERWDAAGNKMIPTLKMASAEAEATGNAFMNFAGKLAKIAGTVVLWMSAYTAFFAVMGAIGSGIHSMIELDAKTAQLQSVMRGTREQAQGLRDDVIQLAIATGRSADEATDAAIRWARLGLTHQQVAAATEISLKSANISGLTAEQSTEAWQGIMASFNLTIPQLNSAFEQMNALAIRFNASDKELMAGLSRTGALAHQMGMDLSEAMSLISLISGETGRPGAESGNALKRYMTNLARPTTQGYLRGIGVSEQNDDGTMKSQRDLLDELSLKYQTLGEKERQEMLYRVAGTMQASRLAIVLSDLTKARELEINALTDFNRADIENQVRRNTLQKDLEALKTSWQQFWIYVGEDMGALDKLRSLVEGLREFMAMMPGGKSPDHSDQADIRKQRLAAVESLPHASPGAWTIFTDPVNRTPQSQKYLYSWQGSDSQEVFDKRMEQNRIEAEQYMQGRMNVLKPKVDANQASGTERAEFMHYQNYFDRYREAQYDQKQNDFMRDDKTLENLRARAEAYRDIQKEMSYGVKMVQQSKDTGSLSDRLENISAGSNPEDLVARRAFTEEMRKAEAIENESARKNAIITLLLERQNSAKQQQLAADKDMLAQRTALINKDEEALTKNKAAQDEILGKVKGARDAESDEKLGALDKERFAIMDHLRRLRSDTQDMFEQEDRDNAGIPPDTDKVSEQKGVFASIEKLYGTLPESRTAVAKVERQKQILEAQKEALKSANLSADDAMKLQVELTDKERELNAQAAYAPYDDAFTEGSRHGKIESEQYEVGRTEGEKLIRERRGITGGGGDVGLLNEAMLRFQSAQDGSLEKSKAQAEILTLQGRLEQTQLELEERRYRVAADIANERERELRAASESLLMADREAQLRAAGIKKYTSQYGAFSREEFQFLDQSTKEAVKDYVPDALPPEYETHRRELEREQSSVNRALGTSSAGNEQLGNQITDSLASLLPSLLGGSGARGAVPGVPLPPVNVTLGSEFAQAMAGLKPAIMAQIQPQLNTIMSILRTTVKHDPASDAAHAASGYLPQ